MKESSIAHVKELYATFEGREELRGVWRDAHPDVPVPSWLEEEEPDMQNAESVS